MFKLLWLVILLQTSFFVAAKPATPTLFINTYGLQVDLHWSKIDNASGYRLYYAPHPFQGIETIASLDLSNDTDFSIELWQNAAYYVAVTAYNSAQENSDYSNIGFLQIIDRGIEYRTFWQSIIQEITQNKFVSDEFLYQQLPDIDNCFSGSLNDLAKTRQLDTLNQIRQLHSLDLVSIDDTANVSLQNAALIQKTNNFLSHHPEENSQCFTPSGLKGSTNSNLSLSSINIDPADDLIGLVDDAFNVAEVGAVGHRRHFLNPFLQFTSYGQVFGASAVQVFDFSKQTSNSLVTPPEFVAFPNKRYPYIFFSDKESNKQTPWNLTLIENKQSIFANKFDYFSNSSISVTRKDTGQNLFVTRVSTDTKNIGVPNNLSWVVENWQFDTWYNVSIINIKYQSGTIKNIEYDVFIDYKNFFQVAFALEENDQWINESQIQGKLTDI